MRGLKLNGLEMGIEVKQVHNGTKRSAKIIFKLFPTKLLKYKASYTHQHKSNYIISLLIYPPFYDYHQSSRRFSLLGSCHK